MNRRTFLLSTALATFGGFARAETGSIAITDAFARASLPNAPVGGGFVTITNSGDTDERLIAVRSDIAMRSEIHEMTMQAEVMQMRPLPDGIIIPAGETVVMAPGGLHLMFMGLSAPLAMGKTLPITLIFEQAGEIRVDLAIGAPNARTATGQ